jgi:hypothetical protein
MAPAVHETFRTLSSMMNEKLKRRWAACEALALGRGGISAVASATGMSRVTIRKGIHEVQHTFGDLAEQLRGERVRQPGAGYMGADQYIFCRQGGWSWSIPFLAGTYALACQVEPKMTPERFWQLALKTGRSIQLTQGGKAVPLGPIIDPVALIDAISRK